MGAEVFGYALDPKPHAVLYTQLGLADRLVSDHRDDINNRQALSSLLKEIRPEVVFHLAAQPLVRLSYELPVETFATNVIGTANLLDAIRLAGSPCRVVAVTTDKCYENHEWLYGYREEDSMGGYDPYSASKGAAELVIASYRNSFFQENTGIRLASARAGNVIGGGDWAKDRIVPDSFRALASGGEIAVRNKIATRPWQHVLEPLSGYLWLAARLVAESREEVDLDSAFNFGPLLTSNRTVAELVQEIIKHTGGKWYDASDPAARHEASKLNLATDKAFHLLKWQSVWNFEETIARTVDWYLATTKGSDPADLTRAQILAYQSSAAQKSIPWAL